MKRSKAVEIPRTSKLAEESCDWYDAYQMIVDDPSGSIDAWTVGEIFLQHSPWWARFLFWLRNAAVRWVGLKTGSMDVDQARELLEAFRNMEEAEFPQELGVVGAKIFSASKREIIAGADDWHLDFRGSVLAERLENQTLVTLITVVRFQHWFGRLYFLPVKPFHKLIVRNMLRRFDPALSLGAGENGPKR